MIALHGLSKSYGAITAVDDLTLQVTAGEVFGFLGLNGAGKTTTIKMIMGLLRPSRGRIVLGGFDIQQQPLEAKGLCGFVPDRPHLYDKLSGRELLHFVAGLYGVAPPVAKRRGDRLLAMFGLDAWAEGLVESYSHGMKQRLALAAALVHSPRILIVDEPMVGMDPHGALLLKRIFRELADSGVAVFLSTHSLAIAQQTCDRIGILHHGKLLAHGSIEGLRRAAAMPEADLETVFLHMTGSQTPQHSLADLDV